MTSSDSEKRFEFAKRLVRDAGDLALGYFRDLSSLKVESKGLQDMASQADLETEELIRDRIASAYPKDAFFGEETGGLEPAADQGLWVVDPIDGTACFVAGNANWCISIAYVVNARIVFGLVYDPARDELFAALRGRGATLNGAPIAPAPATDLTQGQFSVGFSHRSKPEQVVTVIDGLLRAGGMYVSSGSGALGLIQVACGRTIGYYEPHINSWDCYGAVAVLREAGADVCDAEAGNGLTQGCEIIATAPGVTAEFAALLAAAKAAAKG